MHFVVYAKCIDKCFSRMERINSLQQDKVLGVLHCCNGHSDSDLNPKVLRQCFIEYIIIECLQPKMCLKK